jgi:hypothetical protein
MSKSGKDGSRVVQGPFAAITAAQNVYEEVFHCRGDAEMCAEDVCDALTRMVSVVWVGG